MSSKTASTLSLAQCKRIQANQYRSACNRFDYQAEEVEERIIELQSRKDYLFTAFLVSNAGKRYNDAKNLVNEGITAARDWMNQPDETYKNNNGGYVVIPPVIMEF